MKHDVIAFLTHLAEIVGPEARFVHQGMTSSDVLDTCLSVQLKRAADILIADVDAIAGSAQETRLRIQDDADHRPQPRHPRRAHDIRREARGLLCGIRARRARLVAAREEISACAISGAVGTFANIDPRVEEHVAAKLGLAVEPVSTPGDPARPPRGVFRNAWAWSQVRLNGWPPKSAICSAPKCCEAEEYFSAGQKGSSAMPHKRNPVLTENITGLARMVRAYAMPAMENVALWHERDISHSSVERYIGPDATITLDFALVACSRRDREAHRLSRTHAGEPRSHAAAWCTASACCWR